MRTTISRRAAMALATVALTVPAAAIAAAPATAAPYCGITWGSLAKSTGPAVMWTGAYERARYAEHSCYDRLVFDLGRGSGTLGYTVKYVNQVTAPGSGMPVPVAGGARLQITINAPANRTPVGLPVSFPGWHTFRQLVWAGSFEGYTDLGLGVRARLPMRAFVLTDADGGRRLVVDVARAW